MSVDFQAVRRHIKSGGMHKTELIDGMTFSGDDPGDIIGLRVFTRTDASARWRKQFVFWGKPDSTIRTLRSTWETWIAQDDGDPS